MTLEDRLDQSIRTGAPRRMLRCDITNCPWCGGEIEIAAERMPDLDKHVTCLGCGRESVVMPQRDDVVIQGLRSPADLKYLAAMSA